MPREVSSISSIDDLQMLYVLLTRPLIYTDHSDSRGALKFVLGWSI